MSLAVDNPILNNPFSSRRIRGADVEPKEYWIYDERQPKNYTRRERKYGFKIG